MKEGIIFAGYSLTMTFAVPIEDVPDCGQCMVRVGQDRHRHLSYFYLCTLHFTGNSNVLSNSYQYHRGSFTPMHG